MAENSDRATTDTKPRAEGIRSVLSIAGSDSGGGAGIQADLKAFARCGVHGMTAITAITAQNTVGVDAIEPVSPAMIIAQVEAVTEDIGVDAVKIGMLGTVETIEAVAKALELTGEAAVVVDPVMVSESGADLLLPEARDAMIELILPRAEVLTPNIPEAQALTGLDDSAGQEELARRIFEMGPRAVVVTGGHSEGLTDLLFDGRNAVAIEGPRHRATSSHGSGCTHSSVLAAHLALGFDRLESARAARRIAAEAVAGGLDSIGRGPGPVDVLGLSGG
ncbi:MAG: bifunctional hydroxymethylpyrimidine kinase/phosphomethylpyrimidine kinase [Solirubrobacterales bacterium]|nr:bifunctional hydroxymethylpyrimidine kinase/phosphomethylpyrimidine kinase [Solirubrobacterales bacterium]